jgi:hypothetical protein
MILLGLLTKLHARYRKGPNDVDLHFFIKLSKTIENWKKLQPMMVNVMDFSIKILGTIRTNNIHLSKEMAEWNMP